MSYHADQPIVRVEILAILIVIGVCTFLVMAEINGRHKIQVCSVACINNLKQVGLASRIFATDHQDRFPWLLSTNQGGTREFIGLGKPYVHFQVLSNELGSPKILTCPEDTRKSATNFAHLQNKQISYFVGIDSAETKPNLFLSGDRNITNGFPPTNAIISLRTNDNVRWTKGLHYPKGNVALGDGSVSQVESDTKLLEFLSKTGDATNRVALPLVE